MGTEGIVAPGADRGGGVVAQRRIVTGRQVKKDLFDLIDFVDLERLHLPEPLRRGTRAIVGWIEDVMEPALCVRITLVLAQLDRNRVGDMVKELPVVNR